MTYDLSKIEAFKEMSRVKKRAPFKTNNVTAEAGEEFAEQHYGVEPAPVNTKGYDLIDKKNRRVQVKTRKGSNFNIDDVRSLSDFDIIALVTHNDDGDFTGLYEITSKEYKKHSTFRKDRLCFSLSVSPKMLKGWTNHARV